MARREFTFPEFYEVRIEELLGRLGFTLGRPSALADAVLKLSDLYTQNPLAATPWHEPWAQAASLVYYLPLNYARSLAVSTEAKRLGFLDGITHWSDLGSGMGAASLALIDSFDQTVSENSSRFTAVDIHSGALDLGRHLFGATTRNVAWEMKTADLRSTSLHNPRIDGGGRGMIASYFLTELENAPKLLASFDALFLIEPSTRDDGRRLMKLRSELKAQGFHLWAPCTHEGPCPLLEHSVRDWCHDRIHWKAPTWFADIEKLLPMKNRTLTFSYLLAKKTPPPSRLASMARLVGDRLEEKGKTRQMLCRGSEREFLTWFPQRFPKGSPELDLERGHLVNLAPDLMKKSDEVRLKLPSDVEEILATTEISQN